MFKAKSVRVWGPLIILGLQFSQDALARDWSKLSATMAYPNGNTYFFFNDGTYTLQDSNSSVLRPVNYKVGKFWKGIKDEWAKKIIGATVYNYNNKAYFFLNDGRFIRWDIKTDKLDRNPISTAKWWKGTKEHVDDIVAVTQYVTNGKTYFFLKDGSYVRYNRHTDKVDQGAKPLKGNWKGFKEGWAKKVVAATEYKNRRYSEDLQQKTYFFLNDGTYVIWENANDEMLSQSPTTMTNKWDNGFPWDKTFPSINEKAKPGDYDSADITDGDDEPKPWLLEAAKDWMALLPDDTDLRKLSIPGTHNSFAFRWKGDACQNQTWSVEQQLNVGIRYFDLRLVPHNDKFHIYHGECDLTMEFGDALKLVRKFLRSHPGETILLRVKEEDRDDDDEEFNKIWSNYKNRWGFGGLFAKREVYDDEKKLELGKLRGKIWLLCQRSSLGQCGNFGMKYTSDGIEIQDKYEVWATDVSLKHKKRLIQTHILNANTNAQLRLEDRKLYLNHLSGAYGMIPRDVAKATHESTYNYLEKNNIKTTGVLIMDYPGEWLIYNILKRNFH